MVIVVLFPLLQAVREDGTAVLPCPVTPLRWGCHVLPISTPIFQFVFVLNNIASMILIQSSPPFKCACLRFPRWQLVLRSKKKVYMYTYVISYAAQVPIMVYFEAHHVVSYHAEKSAFCPLFPCRYSMDLIDYQKSIIVIFLQSRIASCSWPHGIPASCLWLLRYVVVWYVVWSLHVLIE